MSDRNMPIENESPHPPQAPDVRAYIERLKQPYQGPPENSDDEFVDRLVAATALRALHAEIDGDIALNGVGWWNSTLNARARVHVSDHLVECVNAVSVRLADARLHVLEMSLAVEDENRVFASAKRLPPERESPFAELPGRMARLHAIGALHAVQGALDCLGAVVVGVAGLPTSIRKADLQYAQRAFPRVDRVQTPGEEFQSWLHDELDRIVSAAGPSGWKLWSEKMRNGYAHRPDPILTYTNVPVVRGVQGRIVAGVQIVPRLPSEPDFGPLEAFERAAFNPLAEDARLTLNGLIDSANQVAEGAASALRLFWEARRLCPDLIAQPDRQWSEPAACKFDGYAPDAAMFEIDQVRVNPSLFARMVRGGIGTPLRGQP